MSDAVLTDGEVEQFVREGVFPLKGAFPRELADECRQLLWAATGCDERDPTTWTKPVIRIEGRGDAPFAAANQHRALAHSVRSARRTRPLGSSQWDWNLPDPVSRERRPARRRLAH